MCPVKAHCDNPMENYHPAAVPLSYKEGLSIFQLAVLVFGQTNVLLWLTALLNIIYSHSRQLLSYNKVICNRQSKLATCK